RHTPQKQSPRGMGRAGWRQVWGLRLFGNVLDAFGIPVEVFQQAFVQLVGCHGVQQLCSGFFGVVLEPRQQATALHRLQRFDDGEQKRFLRQELALHFSQLRGLVSKEIHMSPFSCQCEL
ncbi:hypothetical protein, partial [Comamonas sp. UBA7528]|uniref:hypothetical protein n=1 Tax=Comamonas sp. UBA7528 TaxID=1946391 RepID=UPI0025BE70A4